MAKRFLGAVFCFVFFWVLTSANIVTAQQAEGNDLLQAEGASGAPAADPSEEPGQQPSKPDHFTKYELPDLATLGADVKIHTVQPKDTLWGIALAYLGSGMLWPQIWEANKYITDPHWIYPGDPVVIPQPIMVAEIEPPAPETEEKVEVLREAKPVPVASQSDVNCSFFFEKIAKKRRSVSTKKAEANMPRIVGSEEPKIGLSVGDVVYVNRGAADAVIPGDEFFIVNEGDLIYHPSTLQLIGRNVNMVGRIVVIATQEHASTARIDLACDTAPIGSRLIPFTQIPIPLASGYMSTSRYWTESSGKKEGYVIFAKDNMVGASDGALMGIDLGSRDGIVPGDFLTIFRPNAANPGLPRQILGDMVVLTVGDDTATTRITNSYDTIEKGDRVELK